MYKGVPAIDPATVTPGLCCLAMRSPSPEHAVVGDEEVVQLDVAVDDAGVVRGLRPAGRPG
jgi:hypothetical protein